MIFRFLGILSFCLSSSSFLMTNQKYRKLRILETNNRPNHETNCVLFFTGGSNAISPSIYGDFFESLNRKNMAVYVPSFGYKHMACLIRILNHRYKKLNMIGHSSGCNTLMNQLENQTHVENVVLLDPVNTKFLGPNTFEAPYLKTLLFIHAEKSYKVNEDPYGLPFIPFLRLTKEQINGKALGRIIDVTATNYGHSDLLNPLYSNIMHFTRITVGNKNRSNDQLYGYHDQLSETILHFMEEEKTHCPTFLPQKIWDE